MTTTLADDTEYVPQPHPVPCARCAAPCYRGEEHPCCRVWNVTGPAGRCPACHTPTEIRYPRLTADKKFLVQQSKYS